MKRKFSFEKDKIIAKDPIDSLDTNIFTKGFIQVYTGNGKGKTTASLGLALRAVGQGFNVLMIQFMKKGINSGELKSALKSLPQLKIIAVGRKNFVDSKTPYPEDFQCAKRGWDLAKRSVESKKYNIIILDEINVAIKYGLIPLSDVLDLIKNKPENLELILTGRYANSEILNCADLVTEMKERKHYYKKGVTRRVGIEL
jgi:cob(I)alamin adenosyltransferase